MIADADPDERGSVSALVIVFTVALLLVAGLVVDGGFILTARRQAINEAEAAARAGAQATIFTPSGTKLDPLAARQRAEGYLAQTGHSGTVSIDVDTITVAISFEKRLTILGLGGLSSVTVHGRGSARGATGVLQQGDL